MNIYFAPMEGVTGYLYRNAHHTFFPNVDKYFTPFIVATQKGSLRSKELRDILPENNKGVTLVPQILTNNADDFIQLSKQMSQIGHSTINLNLGCPSGTVVAKKKGSGFLAYTDELDRFLERIFQESDTKISIKTRIGKEEPDEFYDLMKIYNQYPLEELIIHPRIQKDYYKNKPRMDIFKDALASSKNPICYNGDIFTLLDYQRFREEYPEVKSIMLGRGLLGNPGLIEHIKGNQGLDKEVLRKFYQRIYEDYKGILSGERNVLFKMKELWYYMIPLFTNHEKYAKKIRKSEKLVKYDEVVSCLFEEQELIQGGGFVPPK